MSCRPAPGPTREAGHLQPSFRPRAAPSFEARPCGAATTTSDRFCAWLDRLKPKVLTSQTITNVDPYQAMLINRNRGGSMLLGGQTLYILECHPAGYAVLAANEAEKAANIRLLEVITFGAFGRLWLGGTEADRTTPGDTALTLIPLGPSSWASSFTSM